VTEFPLAVPLRIRLNPADLSAISSPLSGEGVTAGREVRWVPDPSIAPGGCFVEGPESLVDGRVDKALENIYDKLVYG
jgi:flagellar biosynthesis/type III secretory pathway protein FliH